MQPYLHTLTHHNYTQLHTLVGVDEGAEEDARVSADACRATS